jgi:hypothetical protein
VSVILLPDKWRRQPTGPVAVRPQWVGRGLTALYVLNARSWRINAVTGVLGGIASGTGHTYGPESITSSGIGTEHFDFAVGVTPATIVIGYATISGSVAWSNLRRDIPEWSGLFDQSATASNDFAGFIGTLPTRGIGIPTYAFRWTEQNNYRGVADGGTVQVDTSTGAVPGNRSSISLGISKRWGIADNPSETRATLIAAFSQGLSDPEMQAITAAPWGELVRKQPRILYFTAPSGGGATIAGDSGTYALTGSDVSLKAGRKLAADSGSYSLSGTDAAFKRGYALVASSGTYTVSGTAVSLKAGRKLAADSGSYTLTGTDATLTYAPAGGYNLTAESGSYSLTGTAATLKVSRKLSADSGAYSLTGTTATLAKGVRMAAASGSYTLTGSNVSFARTYVLTAESGSYTLTGTSAGLTWSGAPVVEVPTNGGPSIYGKPVFREREFRREYEEQVKRIEDEKRLARILREDEEIICIMALMAA